MTTTLLLLALVAAANPVRAHAVRPDPVSGGVLGWAAGVSMLAVVVAAAVSGPLLDLVDVSVSSARIAAGMALVIVAAKDALFSPPVPQPALSGDRAGLLPIAFPAILTPAAVLLVVAAAAHRGVVEAVLAGAVAVGVALLAVRGPSLRFVRPLLASTGAAGVAIGVMVVLDGVRAI